MTYSVLIPKRVQKEIDALSPPIRDRIVGCLKDLRENPRPPGCKKMKNADTWRVRVGDYRIIYEVRDQQLIVTLVRVGHRREIYR